MTMLLGMRGWLRLSTLGISDRMSVDGASSVCEEVQETPDKEVLLNLRNTIEPYAQHCSFVASWQIRLFPRSALPLELQKGTVAS